MGDPKIQGDKIILPDGGTAPNTPKNREMLGIVDQATRTLKEAGQGAALAASDLNKAATQAAGRSAQETPSEQLETLKDAGVMGAAGATSDADDEILGILGGIGAAIGQPFKDPRVMAPQGYHMARDAQRARKAIAAERSPVVGGIAYGAGQVGQQIAANALLPGSGALAKAGRFATGTLQVAEDANLARKVGTGLANAIGPGMVIGANQAQSLEDIPEKAATGALIGAAASTAARLPGGIRRLAAKPSVGRFAKTKENVAFLKAGGATPSQVTEITREPGGLEEAVRRRKELGIGQGWFPNVYANLEQADAAVNLADREAQTLASQAGHVTVPMGGVTQPWKTKAQELTTAERDIADRYLKEAQAYEERAGRPVYETISGRYEPEAPWQPGPAQGPIQATIEETGPIAAQARMRPAAPSAAGLPEGYAPRALPQRGDSLAEASPIWAQAERGALPGGSDLAEAPIQAQARFADDGMVPHQPGGSPTNGPSRPGSAIVAGTPWEEAYQTGREISFPDLVKERAAMGRRGFKAHAGKDLDSAEIYRDIHGMMNDTLENAVNRAEAEGAIPGELGTQWRNKNQELHTAMDARSMAQTGIGKDTSLADAAAVGGQVAGAGVRLPQVDPARAVGTAAKIIAKQPGVQYRFWQGVGAVNKAAQNAPMTPLGRALSYLPSGNTLSRVVVNKATQEGITAVQQAALQGDDKAVSEYYRNMLTNPDMNRAILSEE